MARVVKLCVVLILAAWIGVWILKPTRVWKSSWHTAEDWAESTFLRKSGLNVIIFCFPLLAAAVLLYINIHLISKEGRIRQRTSSPIARLPNPVIINSQIGILSSVELLVATLFIAFLAWTYYSNLASDLKRMIPSKVLKLNIRQLKTMAIGVRFGSLTEACLVLLLIPVLRKMALLTAFGVQFETSVKYHIWFGNGIMLFSVLHSVIIMSIWAEKNSLFIEIRKWQRTGRVYVAGAISLVTLLIIYISSLPLIRRKSFQIFYSLHHLYIVFIFFFLMHAGTGHFYLVFSGILLFALDKMLRIVQSRQSTRVISARVLACEAIELTLQTHSSMQYTPTSTIFIKIPTISRLQWHPFSIISSCNENNDSLSILIKCQGHWTNSLYEYIKSGNLKSVLVSIEGPYGPPIFSYQNYDSLILIAGGSGITPFLSILQDVALKNLDIKMRLIYVVKKTVDLTMLTPISMLLLGRSRYFKQLEVKTFVTRENDRSGMSLEDALLEISQTKIVTFDRSTKEKCLPRNEGVLVKATVIKIASVAFLVSTVCLTNAFIGKERRSSQNKTPSWISNVLVICSFVVATSCGIVFASVISNFRSDVEAPAVARDQMFSDSIEDTRKDEMSFGKRPDFNDIVSEVRNEMGGSEAGVFVCGPESMQRSVASACRKCSSQRDEKNKFVLSFHSINFSL